MQLFSAVSHSHSVPRIDYPNNGIRLFKVVAPIWSKRPLTAYVP